MPDGRRAFMMGNALVVGLVVPRSGKSLAEMICKDDTGSACGSLGWNLARRDPQVSIQCLDRVPSIMGASRSIGTEP